MPDPLLSLTLFVILFGLSALIFWPAWGLVARWRRAQALSARVLYEDALKHLYKQLAAGRRPTMQGVAGAVHVSLNQAASLLAEMTEQGLLTQAGDDWRLTPQGRSAALNIIRAHRLYEAYLAEETGFGQTEWHQRADRTEHLLSPEDADALAAQLGNPSYDPHGDPIPTADGNPGGHGGRSLNLMTVGDSLQVVHVEDEPEAVYAQLLAEGIHPGMVGRLLEKTPQRLVLWAEGAEHVLAPMVAANLSVMPLPAAPALAEESGDPLSALRPGDEAQVLRISPLCRGAERRRFLDLGIVPGTVVAAELISPSGDPIAYRIRGALIALRREQAQLIRVADIRRAQIA